MTGFDYIFLALYIWVMALALIAGGVAAVSEKRWLSAILDALAVYTLIRWGILLWSMHYGIPL